MKRESSYRPIHHYRQNRYAAMSNGADLPFSCKGGVCATCKARVMEGEVDMDLNHALTDQEVAEGMILTCQAHPVSRKVVIDFDQL